MDKIIFTILFAYNIYYTFEKGCNINDISNCTSQDARHKDIYFMMKVKNKIKVVQHIIKILINSMLIIIYLLSE